MGFDCAGLILGIVEFLLLVELFLVDVCVAICQCGGICVLIGFLRGLWGCGVECVDSWCVG